ncbi:MAG: hypothetical protein ACR2QW_17150 [bacterium]
MNEHELNDLIDANLELAFDHFENISGENSSKDNGDTVRILRLIEEVTD